MLPTFRGSSIAVRRAIPYPSGTLREPDSFASRALAINSLSIAEAVPEPRNIAAMIVAGLGLLALKIKRRSLFVK